MIANKCVKKAYDLIIELEAYSSVITAFRAQGEISK